MKKLPLISLFLIIFSVLISTLTGFSDHYELNPANPEFITIFTGHFTHWDMNQLFWDGAVFFVLAVIYELNYFSEIKQKKTLSLCLVLIFSALFISTGLSLIYTDKYSAYRGLSGLCSALFVLIIADLGKQALKNNQQNILRVAILSYLGLIAKITFESFSGNAIFTSPGNYSVCHQAHFLGAAAASILIIVKIIKVYLNQVLVNYTYGSVSQDLPEDRYQVFSQVS